MIKRVFLIVLDSFGIGELPDAAAFGDEGSNTLKTIQKSKMFHAPNLERLGLFHINGVFPKSNNAAIGSFAKMNEKSAGKDTTVGHWEIMGIISEKALPVFPNGFPPKIIDAFEKATGHGTLCNKPYSGTEVIKDYGEEHIKTGKLIVYTSADSVFQIAAHEDIVSVAELYKYCETARELLQGDYGVGRVIARPFNGEYPFHRTANRHDFSILPPAETHLDILKEKGYDVISVGKISDIFGGKGITASYKTVSNRDGMDKTIALAKTPFSGLCFVNLVDFDSAYGHRNDIDGYANAISEFDIRLNELMSLLRQDDILIITADHGCDPGTPSTDHSREYTPMLIYGDTVKQGVDLGIRTSFADIGATILEIFGLDKKQTAGTGFWKDVKNDRL